MVRLNLGSGEVMLDGYENLDIKRGDSIYPLHHFADASVDEVRASHVLEHFSHREVGAVLADWVRVLKPGGVLKIAVPNFRWIAENYLKGEKVNVQGYTMGGHVDADDYHKCVFDEEVLREAMERLGLVSIHPWASDQQDCAALPVSLNLMGTKPIQAASRKVGAAMSTPRLGFMDNFFCAFQSLVPLGIGLRKHTGAFWGQCLERTIDEWLAEGADYILTIDYDTVFSKQHAMDLLRLMDAHPEADAIAPIQASRSKSTPLFTIRDDDGKMISQMSRETFNTDLLRANTAHFGLTLLRADAIRRMSRPLFKGEPAPDGTWGDGRTDDDIYFWRKWAECGNSLYLAPRVSVGHAELMVRWPDQNLEPMYQHPSDFFDHGVPEWAWQ